jgi:hypothetical protein
MLSTSAAGMCGSALQQHLVVLVCKCGNFAVFCLNSGWVGAGVDSSSIGQARRDVCDKRAHEIEPMSASLSASHMKERARELNKGGKEARG